MNAWIGAPPTLPELTVWVLAAFVIWMSLFGMCRLLGLPHPVVFTAIASWVIAHFLVPAAIALAQSAAVTGWLLSSVQ